MKLFQIVAAFTALPGIVFFMTSCQTAELTQQLQATSVVTVDQKIESVYSFKTMLNDAVTEIRTSDKYDNFILLVHGRGKHPWKAFKKSLISDLESNYTAKVIMYHWPSWEGTLAFPEGKARASAREFSIVLGELQKYRHDNRRLLKDIKFTLLTHSMGSIVLEELILNSNNHSFSTLFDTVVISSSASAASNHSSWVSRINFSDNIYITVNQDDPILRRMKGQQLGLTLSSKEGIEFELAGNTTYIDVTEASLGHRYYLHRNLKKSPFVKAFFNRVLNGDNPILNEDNGVKEVYRKQVFVLKQS